MRRFEPQLPRGIIKPGDEGWRDFEREQRDRDRRYRDDLLDAPIVIETPLGKLPVSGVKNRSTSGNNGSTPGHNKPPGNPGTGGPPPIGGTPAQVSGLALTAGDRQVALTWDTTTGASYYIIYRSTSSGQETQLTTSATNSYTDTNVSNGTTYYYQVSAVKGSREGTKSSEASATPAVAFVPSSVAGYLFEYRSDQSIYSDAGTTPVTNGGTVQQWNDISGNNHHISQATSSKRPVYNTGQINGKPGVTFDGVDDFLKATFTFTRPNTIYMVCKNITMTINDLLCDGATQTHMRFSQVSSSPATLRVTATGGVNLDSTTGVVSGAWQQYECQWATDGVNSGELFKVNNEADHTAPTSALTGNADGFTLAADGTGAANANIQVAHVIGYQAIPSASDRAAIWNYLNAIYAIF